jgi:hypothetical protein
MLSLSKDDTTLLLLPHEFNLHPNIITTNNLHY